ncbi:polysaccharide deacetylase family protein [Acidiferrimicrobium sp. IK]|uniref:polysaccharide deacetylase family protein n=1 Tax=Acidiferrimicrobium sp. IK TaxID=2871700 RepID=UPI0021CB2F00|nr:polysaccharide deacetylase family protein [Acidiferrimicrobium sp. IK]MCU4186204.1 polysaccharide deacetylase family protein [Acidiferrimicrobium sp. IK]
MSEDRERRRISLTFDNGPTPGVTDAVLDVLAARGVPATFFVVGANLRRPGGRDLVRRACREGHRIGHHTTTHTVLLGAAVDAEAAVDTEIAALAAELTEFDGDEKLYRPYAAGGVLDRQVLSAAALRYLQDHRYTCVLWNSVPHDWDDPDGWVERALADAEAGPWTVVVLHDVDSGAMAHLGSFIDELRRRDIDIVQDLPDSCVPISRGEIRVSLDHLLPLSPTS